MLEESLYLSHRASQVTVIIGYSIYVIQLFPKLIQFFTSKYGTEIWPSFKSDIKTQRNLLRYLNDQMFSIPAIFAVGRLFVSLYGNLHAGLVLMKHLIDPAQFVLFWVTLLINQVWNEYFTVSLSTFVPNLIP